MERYELKLGKAQAPVRVAVTGQGGGPAVVRVDGGARRASETLRRLAAAAERAAAESAAEGDRRDGSRVRTPLG